MKHITSKLLSLLLCLAMLMSMVPVAYAVDGTGDATEGNTPTETYVAKIGNQTFGSLADAIAAANSGDTIYLGAGNFTLYNVNKGKTQNTTLTIIGSGKDRTVFGIGKDPATEQGEYNADYSYENSNVTFKDMNIVMGATTGSNKTGIARASSLSFEDCKITECGYYWGIGAVNFKDCVFDSSQYNIWTYAGKSFTFDTCTFTSSVGKFVNAYKEECTDTTPLNFTNCTFMSENKNKPAVCLKSYKDNAWKVSFDGCNVDGCQPLPNESGYEVFDSPYYTVKVSDGTNNVCPTKTLVTIDGKVVWENGAKADASAGVIADDKKADNGTVTATVTGTPAADDKTIEVNAKVSNATEIKSAAVTVKSATLAALTGEDSSVQTVTINTDVGTLSIDGKALTVMQGAASGADVTLKIEKTEPAAGDTFKAKYELTAKAGNTNVFTNVSGSGEVTVTVPYELETEGATPVVYYVDGETKTNMNATYNKETETLSWSTSHFSTYVVEVVAAVTDVAKIGGTNYATLAAALEAAKDGETVTLLADATEDVTINKSITLDLGGKTLTNTNAGKATLTVAAGATATVKNGSIVGGTSFYTIQNNGTATFEVVTATAGNTDSSMIDNWGTMTINSGDYSGGLDVVKSEPGATLLITGGTFALNHAVAWSYTGVVLSYGDLTITGGTFNQNATTPAGAYPTVVVTAKDKVDDPTPHTKITGGVFNNTHSSSRAKIFHPMSKATSDNFEVSGGTYNKSVSDSFFKTGYIPVKNADGTYGVKEGKFVVEVGSTGYETFDEAIAAANASATSTTIYLRENLTVDHQIIINNTNGKKITLNLKNFTLTSTYALKETSSEARYALVNKTALEVKNGTFAAGEARAIGGYAALTLNGATVTQTLTGGHACVAFCAAGATYTIKNSTISGDYAVANFAHNANITISSAVLEGKTCGLYHNGSNYGLKLKVTGTTINGSLDGTIGSENDPSGVYISGSTSHGTMQNATFTNCTIKGATAIEVKYTDLTLDECTVEATVKTPSYDKNSNGMTALGFAVVSTDNSKAGETPVPTGTVTIKGNGSYTGLVGLGALESVKNTYTDFKDETIQVSGGTFSSEVKPEYCAPGFVPTMNADGTYGVKEGAYVAEVNGVKYETLQKAINAAKRNNTIKLLADTKENVTISTSDVTLDLNGHTLNGGTEKGKPALTITARVTVMDSSEGHTGTIMREDTAENSGVSSHYVIDVQDGWLTFESGNVTNNSGNALGEGASLVRVGDAKVPKYPGLNIKGGTFTQNNFIVIKVGHGDLFLNGGTLNCADSYAVENWHRATIKGGTVNGNVAAWTYSGGPNSDLTISGGTVNGNVEAVSYDGAEGKLAKVAITGGTVNGTLSTKRYNNATAPGKDMATIEVTGGTFKNDPSGYLVEDSAATKNKNGTYDVAKAYLAKVGNTSYYTMEEAFKAQTASGEPIVLLRDYTTGSPFNSGTVARVVNLNGHTWTCTGTDANSAAFEINNRNASLTVKNGKIVSSQLVGLIPSAMGGTIKYDNSSLTFENVEMSTTATSGIETNGGNTNDTVKLVNSTLNVPNGFGIYFPSSGTLTIENSTITAKTMGVQVCAGSLNINGDKTAIDVSGDPVEKIEGDGAIQDGAAISIVNRPGYKGLGKIEVTGGKFTAKDANAAIKAYDWNNATKTEETFTESTKVSVSGGTFSSIPDNMDALCKEGYVPVKNAAGYAVQTGTYVASIGTRKFASLAEAVEAAESGATITLLADISNAEGMLVTKNLTIDFGTYTVTGKVGAQVLKVSNAKVTLKGTTGGINGGAGGNNVAVLAGTGADITIEDGVYTVGGDASNNGNATIYIVSNGKVTINGGKFSSECTYAGKYYVLNVQNSASGTFTVNGGTFKDFDPFQGDDNLGGNFCGEGVGVNKDENGNFTAVPNMAAQIVDADGNSVAAYAGHYDAIAAAKDGETVILLSDRKNLVTNTINANITIDLNSKTLSVGNNNPFFRTNGEVTIQNGTITSNLACVIVNAYNKLTLKNVKITGVTGENGKNLVNVCSNAEVTIDKDTVLTASGNNGAAVFIGQDADAKYTLNVYGKVIQESKSFAISGNGSYKGTTTINIYDGAEVKSASVAIYHPQAGAINVNGGLVEGYCAIGIKSGSLNIKGGTVCGTANDNALNDSNSASGTITYDGSAIIVDSRSTGYAGNVNINVTGGTVESYYSTAIREIGEQDKPNMTQLTKLNITGGSVLGASQELGNVTNDMLVRGISVKNVSVSGGSFNHKVQQDYCAIGFVPKDNNNGTYTVAVAENVEATYTDADGVEQADLLVNALSKAKAGTTITLLKDVTDDGNIIIIPVNVTLDLNGNNLTAKMLFANAGIVKDSKEGTGSLKLKNNSWMGMPEENPYLPIYDSSEGVYRFFGYKLEEYDTQNVDGRTMFVYQVTFNSLNALKLLKNGNKETHGVSVQISLSWADLNSPMIFDVSQSAFGNGLENMKDGQPYFLWLTVNKFGTSLEGKEISTSMTIESKGVKTTVDGVSYTVPTTAVN